MLKNITIPFHKLIVVMVTPDLLPEVNKTLGYYLKVISKNNTLRPVRPVRLTPGTSEC